MKILQFGEGNFLRAFAEDYIQTANEKGLINAEVTICQPRINTKTINALKAQGNRYHVYKRGMMNGKVIDESREIHCVSDCIDTVGEYEKLRQVFLDADIVISNTTEAGIVFQPQDKQEDAPMVSFPGKITSLLFERFQTNAAPLVFLPVELIENNADALKDCILQYADLWELGDDFKAYVNSLSFCNTLVDRIVSGHTDGDSDPCSVNCEPYASWIIQADERCRNLLPIEALSGVVFTDDITPFRTRKVRILNGAHTMSVLAAHMCGFTIVRDMVNDNLFHDYIMRGLGEVKCTLHFDEAELDEYIDSVLDRFNNPFIDHRLLDIALNSVSKFEARCLDSLREYTALHGEAPEILCLALAALIAFYMDGTAVRDSEEVVAFFADLQSKDDQTVVRAVLDRFGETNDTIYNKVLLHYISINRVGMKSAVEAVVYG